MSVITIDYATPKIIDWLENLNIKFYVTSYVKDRLPKGFIGTSSLVAIPVHDIHFENETDAIRFAIWITLGID